MPHVPPTGRTRASHRFRNRNTHDYDGSLYGLDGGQEAAGQAALDEVPITPYPLITDVARFAASIRPVILVETNPTLPDVLYPEGSFIYNTTDSPPRLYKNVADAWVAAIGPDDIQANSITAGQIAAGAVSTSELAVGARLTGEVANESGATPGVFIDSGGILIRSGKLTLQDEFDATVVGAAGFSGSWNEFIMNGLYNSSFLAGVGGATVVANGRTSALPYWTVANAAGTATLKHSTGAVSITFSALADKKRISGDAVPVKGGQWYSVPLVLTAAGGPVAMDTFLDLYDSSGAFLDTVTLDSVLLTNSLFPAYGDLTPIQMNVEATHASIRHEFYQSSSHSALNRISLLQTGLVPAPPENLSGHDLLVNTVAANGAVMGSTGDFGGLSADLVALPFVGDSTAAGATVGLRFSDSAMSNTGRVPMPFAGRVLAASIRISSALTAGAFQGEVTIGGSHAIYTPSNNNVGQAASYGRVEADPVAFSAGNEIGLNFISTGAFTPAPQDVYGVVWVQLDTR